MARNQEVFGTGGSPMFDASRVFEMQRSAAENASHMASTLWQYSISMNRAWLRLWNNQLSHYTEMPERLAEAQSNFVEQAFDHYRDSIQQMSGQISGFAAQAQVEAQEMVKKTQAAGEEAVDRFRSESEEVENKIKEAATKTVRPKEHRTHGSSEEAHRRGPH